MTDGLECIELERMCLLEHPRVYLWRSGNPKLETRLGELFRRAWHMIPCDAALAIAAYWRPDPKYPPERIIILKGDDGKIDNATLAITLRSGHRIEFHREVIARCPDEPLIGLILHELAH